MDIEVTKDFGGRIHDYLECQSNGDIIVKDFSFKILGKYDEANDTTKDFCGRILFKGNMVASLIGMYGNK